MKRRKKNFKEVCEVKKAPNKQLKVKFAAPQVKRSLMIEQTITNKQKVQGTIVPPRKKDGSLADFQGIPNWTVTSGNSTVEVAADGQSAFLISSDTNGDTSYLVEATVDFGAGFKSVSTPITLHVSDTGSTESLEVTFAAPVTK